MVFPNRNSPKRKSKLHYLFALPLMVLLVGTGCRVTQEEAGEAPDVDVDVEPGQLPEYDVEGPDVDVETEEREVTVPDVDIETEEREVTVPQIEVTPPGAEEEAQ